MTSSLRNHALVAVLVFASTQLAREKMQGDKK